MVGGSTGVKSVMFDSNQPEDRNRRIGAGAAVFAAGACSGIQGIQGCELWS